MILWNSSPIAKILRKSSKSAYTKTATAGVVVISTPAVLFIEQRSSIMPSVFSSSLRAAVENQEQTYTGHQNESADCKYRCSTRVGCRKFVACGVGDCQDIFQRTVRGFSFFHAPARTSTVNRINPPSIILKRNIRCRDTGLPNQWHNKGNTVPPFMELHRFP